MRSKQVDEILHRMAMIYQNEGIDSTEQDMENAKARELQLIGEISKIDPDLALRLIQ